MSTLQLECTRRKRLADRMLVELESRVSHVEVRETVRGWMCVLSGAGWETRYRGSSRFDAVHAAHSTFYWPQP